MRALAACLVGALVGLAVVLTPAIAGAFTELLRLASR